MTECDKFDVSTSQEFLSTEKAWILDKIKECSGHVSGLAAAIATAKEYA